jgi:molybdate transport system regulatory protein
MAEPASAPQPLPPRLTGRLEVDTDLGSFLGDTRVRLLEAIDQHGSISQAAKHVPLSYKAAWDAVDAMNNLADQPLVARSTGGRAGGGTRLTDHGRRVIALVKASSLLVFTDAALRVSARNQLWGTVARVVDGPVNAEVVIDLGSGRSAVAVLTRDSVAALGLAEGVRACAAFKVSSVILAVID